MEAEYFMNGRITKVTIQNNDFVSGLSHNYSQTGDDGAFPGILDSTGDNKALHGFIYPGELKVRTDSTIGFGNGAFRVCVGD
jgi:hypothetical protein